MALDGNIVQAAKAIELGLATGFGAIGPGAGVGYLMGKTVEVPSGLKIWAWPVATDRMTTSLVAVRAWFPAGAPLAWSRNAARLT